MDSCEKSYILERVPFEQHEEFQITLSCVQFSEHVAKIYFFVMEFLKLFYINFDTFFIFFPQISNINLNMPSRFLSLNFFHLISLFHLILRNYILTQRRLKVLHNLIFMIWLNNLIFINLKEFTVDSINHLGWESNFSFRPPRVFKILTSHLVSYVLGEHVTKYAKNSFTVKIW